MFVEGVCPIDKICFYCYTDLDPAKFEKDASSGLHLTILKHFIVEGEAICLIGDAGLLLLLL